VKIERRAATWLSLYVFSSLVLTVFIPVEVFNPVRIPTKFRDYSFIWDVGDQLDGTFIAVDWVRLAIHHMVALVACTSGYRFLPLVQ
jgi:hypothetical protein